MISFRMRSTNTCATIVSFDAMAKTNVDFVLGIVAIAPMLILHGIP